MNILKLILISLLPILFYVVALVLGFDSSTQQVAFAFGLAIAFVAQFFIPTEEKK